MSETTTYPDPEREGYHLEVVEFDKWDDHSHLTHPVPADEHRYNIQKGELVKLIFVNKHPDETDTGVFRAEHMWVEYLGDGPNCMVGKLDNDPMHSELLKSGDRVHFHPKHIVQIWGYDPDEGVKSGTTELLPKNQLESIHPDPNESGWPFDQAENVAAITTRQVLDQRFPILMVIHYSDDHSWAFLCNTTGKESDGRVIAMDEALKIDPTLKTIASLPPGWIAERTAIGEEWIRHQSPDH